jgi:hypothetical protein
MSERSFSILGGVGIVMMDDFLYGEPQPIQ